MAVYKQARAGTCKSPERKIKEIKQKSKKKINLSFQVGCVLSIYLSPEHARERSGASQCALASRSKKSI